MHVFLRAMRGSSGRVVGTMLVRDRRAGDYLFLLVHDVQCVIPFCVG